MYRKLRADKDSYVTKKIIDSSRPTLSRSTDANVGQAGTLDLFKLYNATPVPSGTSGVELTRAVIHFNLDPIASLTSSIINPNHSSFKCFLSMKDVNGGQTVPSNFSLVVNPLGKAFSEGRGNDVIGFRDLDAVNWFTASIDGGVVTPWTSGGIGYGGESSDGSADYITHLSSPSLGYVPLTFSQSFARGDEDLLIDITSFVSVSLAGAVPNYGFRIAFSGSQETDTVTRFVKRFSSRQSRNSNLHPTLVVKYNDTFFDNQAHLLLDRNNKVGVYNSVFGSPANFISGSTPVSGSGSIMLELVASQSAYVTATTYSFSHQRTITYTSSSWNYFSQSFTGSQISFAGNGIYQTGSYYADVFIQKAAAGLSGVLKPDGSVDMIPVWKSPDNAVTFDVGPSLTFFPQQGKASVAGSRNYITNVVNLQEVYGNSDVVTMRVLTVDFDTTLASFYSPYQIKPKLFENMQWRIIDPFSKEVIIPFDEVGTKLSADGEGMYFKVYMEDLPINRIYELEFLIKENGEANLVQNKGFTFMVIQQ